MVTSQRPRTAAASPPAIDWLLAG